MPDKYKSVWISHSSINDFLSCHRLYYIKNVFKDPVTKRKINLTSPYLTLGIVVHKVIEDLKNIKSDGREKEIKENLLQNFKKEWSKYNLKKGGFKDKEEENKFFERGEEMIKKIINNPRELLNKIIPISYFYEGNMIPNYYLSIEDNIILCGSIDWIEYLEENKIRIIDFKTGRNDEDDDSFQLPIYYLLLTNLQKENNKKVEYKIREAAYWYLDHENKKEESQHNEFQIIKIDEGKIEDIKEAEKKLLEIGKKIKSFREGGDFKCNNEEVVGDGCKHCKQFEKVYKFIENRERERKENTKSIQIDEEYLDDVEYVGVSDYNQDMYFIK